MVLVRTWMLLHLIVLIEFTRSFNDLVVLRLFAFDFGFAIVTLFEFCCVYLVAICRVRC